MTVIQNGHHSKMLPRVSFLHTGILVADRVFPQHINLISPTEWRTYVVISENASQSPTKSQNEVIGAEVDQ